MRKERNWYALERHLTCSLTADAGDRFYRRSQYTTNGVAVFSRLPKTTFYPRDAMLARVFATATCLSVLCLSVCPYVRHTPVLCLAERKQDREMYTV